MAAQGIAVALNVVLRSKAARAALATLSTAIKATAKLGQGLTFGMGLLAKGIGLVKKAAFGAGIALAGMFASAWQSPALAAGIDKIKVALLEFGEIVAPILNKVIDFFLYAINAAKRFFQINRGRIIELLNKLEPIIQGIVDAFFDLGEIALGVAENIVDFIKESEGFQKVRNFIEAIKTSLENQKEAWTNFFTNIITGILKVVNEITGLINKILGIKGDLDDADIDGKFEDAQGSVGGLTTAIETLGRALTTVSGHIDSFKEAWEKFKNSKIGGWISNLLGFGDNGPDGGGEEPKKLTEVINDKIKDFAEKATSVGLNLPGMSKPVADIATGGGSSGGGSSGGRTESDRDRKKKERDRKKKEREAEQKRKQERNKGIFDTAIEYGKKAVDWGKNVISGAGSYIKGIFGFNDGGNVPQTGAYLLHAGERVVPRQQVASGGMGNVSINITTGPVNSQVDLRNLATLISREIAKQNKYGRGSVSVN